MLFCNYALSPGQSLNAAISQQFLTHLTGAHVRDQKCVTPFGGQTIKLENVANIMEPDLPVSDTQTNNGGDLNYKNPFAGNQSLRFVFTNVSFVGVTSHIGFAGMSNETAILTSIMAKLRQHANTGSEYDYMQLGFNSRFAASKLTDYFSEQKVDAAKILRLADSPLRWNTTVIRRFSNFIKQQLVETPSTVKSGIVAMKRPLVVVIDNCKFIGGASFLFTNILPVGTNITVIRTSFIGTFDQMLEDNAFFLPDIFSFSRGILNFQRAHFFGSEIKLENNTVDFLRSPATSANSTFFRHGVWVVEHVHELAYVVNFAEEPTLLHSSSIVVNGLKMLVQGVASDRAGFQHPNISHWQHLIDTYRISSVAATNHLMVNKPIVFSSVIGTADYQDFGVMTEGSQISVSGVSATLDGRNILVPASDAMWLVNTTNASATTTRTTLVPSSTPRPTSYENETQITSTPAPVNITLPEFYRLYPSAAPRNCYVLEVPTQISFSMFHTRTFTWEMSRGSRMALSGNQVRSFGSKLRGGKFPRERDNFGPNSNLSYPPSTDIQRLGPGNAFTVNPSMITDAVAMKISLEIAETLGSVYNNQTYAKATRDFEAKNGYYSIDPESLSIPSNVLTHFLQIRSGVANETLKEKFLELEQILMNTSQSSESPPIVFSDVVRNTYNSRFTSPARVSSTFNSASLYSSIFEGTVMRPLPFSIAYDNGYDVDGIIDLQKTCGYNGTIGVSNEILDAIISAKTTFASFNYDPIGAAVDLEGQEGESNQFAIDSVQGAGGSELPAFVDEATAIINNPRSDPLHIAQQQAIVDKYLSATNRLRSIVSKFYIQSTAGDFTGSLGSANAISVSMIGGWYAHAFSLNTSSMEVLSSSIIIDGIFIHAKMIGLIRLLLFDGSLVSVSESAVLLSDTLSMVNLR